MSSAFRRTSYASVAAGTATPPPSADQLTSALVPRLAPQRTDGSSNTSTPHQPDSRSQPVDMESMDIEKQEQEPTSPKSFTTAHDAAYFTPSYLRRSRHMERLEGRYKQKQRSIKEPRHSGGSGVVSRQPSSASLSLQKASLATHRGVFMEIMEKMAPQRPDRTRPIPTRWSEHDKFNGLEILGGGVEVKYQGTAKTPEEAASVRTDHPIPDNCGLYYYEVTVLSRGKEGLIGVGFSGGKSSLSRLPGWEDHSWGYHGDDGHSFACSSTGKPYGPKFSSLDVIGCGINFRTAAAFFTKNGIYLGDAFFDVTSTRLFPCVGIKKPGEHIRANFGQTPFVFDIDAMMERERRNAFKDVNKHDDNRPQLCPGLNEKDTVEALIGQYLAHEGFTETGNQFARDVKERREAIGGTTNPSPPIMDSDDGSVVNRQRIRAAILAGDIDTAFELLRAFFPKVLDTASNRDLYFRLRCRKFIEMILKSYELQKAFIAAAREAESAPVTNGHGKVATSVAENGDGMQLDLHNGASADGQHHYDDSMEMSTDNLKGTPSFADTKSVEMIRNSRLTDAVQYGMELQAEWNDDLRPEIKNRLNDTFALIAYADARDSGLAEVIAGKERNEIAEQVNGAILVSLGKPRSALLERLCSQTEVLLEMLSEHGGMASFINLQQDYLQ